MVAISRKTRDKFYKNTKQWDSGKKNAIFDI